jgi:hypothetical protein
MTGGMGFWACSAQRQSEAGDVRFGSQADIPIILFDVRFTPESGRSPRDQDVCFGPKADMAIPLAMATLEVRVRENSGAN